MYNVCMNNFIIAGIIVLILCSYFGFKLYQEMAVILNAKRLQEQFKKESFWETQESFEE